MVNRRWCPTRESRRWNKVNQARLQPSCVNANGKLRVLIVSDDAEQFMKIRAALAGDGIEITCASSLEEMCRGCCGWQDLVIVDVDSERAGELLRTLRACEGCAKISILVEASRISADPSQAGLLPACRAMPCGYGDMIMLARRLLFPAPEAYRRPKLL